MVITLKFLIIGLSLGVIAFTISTIVLGVQKSQLANDLNETQEKLEAMEQAMLTSTTSPSTIAPTTTSPTTTSPTTSSPTTTSPTTTSPSTTSTSTTSPSTEPPPNLDIDFRLPKSLKPLNYDLYLHPHIDNGTFHGRLNITIQCIEATQQIILHSLNLTIKSMKLLNDFEMPNISIREFYMDTEREFLIIELNKKISAEHKFQLYLEFEGIMVNKIIGLYSSSYVKADGSRRWIATSKFEPTYARQAFPCFDEPDLKATFTVTLVHPNDENGYHALSNMNVAHEIDRGLYKEIHFNTSVPMSTYLACFIVSDFKWQSTMIQTNGIGSEFEMRAFATPEQIHKVTFALDVGKQIIEHYIDYFQIEYPLPKLDVAAIPDFVSGAMEHWGLVTYRETSLLYDKNVSSTINKQRVAAVIAHEFAHMWFGNLVTMKWWNDLWLNEGFAKYIEHKGVEAAFPLWEMQDQFITGTLHGVLTLDATLATHPIIQPVRNPDEITEIFDAITYSKGSSIIRMLEDFLQPEKFQRAVQNYLNKFKYGNAITDDFLNEINNLPIDYDIKPIMSTWLEQMGLPVIMVKQLEPGTLQLTQKRFLSNPNDYEFINFNDTIYKYKWSIPITYKTNENDTIQRVWFYYDQNELIINVSKSMKWIKFNCDQKGYYRVNYATDMWQILANELKQNHLKFSVADTASLLNDAFALADATQMPYNLALSMTMYLDNEYEYVPWKVAATKFINLKRALLYTDIINDYTNYTCQLLKPIYTYVNGFNIDHDDDHLTSLLRVEILNAACSLDLAECLNEVDEKFIRWLEDPSKQLHPDIREIVYYFGMYKNNNDLNWHKMWQIFVTEQDANEKMKLMKGLAAIQKPNVLNRYIQLAWNETYVRGQDYFNCLEYIASNPIGESLVWDYVREQWPNFVERFTLNDRNLGNLIPAITKHFNSNIKLEEMMQFFEKYPNAGAGSAARLRAINNVKNNIAWLDNNLQALREWFTDNHNMNHKH